MKRNKIGKDILRYVAFGGILTLAMLSSIGGPKVAKSVFKHLKYKIKQVRNSAYYLKKRGLIEFVNEKGDDVVVRITDNGREYLRKFDIENMTLKKPTVWDRKWRLVMFDIPERHRKAREALRRKLKDMNFLRLQHSIWVTPYPCEDEIRFLREIFNIPFNVDVVVTDDLKHHEINLKKYFKLI